MLDSLKIHGLFDKFVICWKIESHRIHGLEERGGFATVSGDEKDTKTFVDEFDTHGCIVAL